MRTALVVIPLFLFVALQPFAAAQPGRIAGIDSRRTVVLRGSVYSKAQPQYDRGAVEAAMPLDYITLLTKPSPQQDADLTRLLAEQQDPGSPNYQKWLTPEQYADRFGLSPDDIEKLSIWLRSQGFTVVQVARGRNWIAFSGTAALVESAFQTEMHYFDVDGERHFANATELSLPASLAGIVVGFRGLNDFSLKPLGIGRASLGDNFFPAIVRPAYNLGGFNFLAPGDIATIYDLGPLYSKGIDGTGEKMVIVGQVDVSASLSDIDNFRSAFGLPKNDPVQTIVPHSPNPGTDSGDMGESKLDLEWAGAVARNATILFITAAKSAGGVFDAVQYAIDQNLAPVLSMSYGGCESENAGFIVNNEVLMQEASSEGITFMAASGDSGAAGCEASSATVASKGLAVNYPASSPEVTGVGGNEFDEGAGSYWTGSGSNGGTAISYIPEMGWNDSPTTGTGSILSSSLSASGGGASSCATAPSKTCTGGFGFPKPMWQAGSGVPADGVRDVPDVAMSASANHDGYIICDGGSCASGVGNSPSVFGGTSASTPVFAGIVTLLNQAVAGTGLGNINQKLYLLAQSSSNGVFHDVKSGSNIVPCTAGTPSCPTKAPFQYGYSAGTGYDQVTGLGSVDADKLITAWTGGATKPATATALSLTAATITAGTSVTFTAAVTHTAGTAVPTGTVTFNNGTTKLGSGTLNSSAKATFQTSMLAGGSYSVTAAYSGDTNYATSTSSAGSLSVQDFQLPSTALTVNVTAPGQSGTTTITVTPLGGFNQAVSFSCSTLPSEAACSFNPVSVTPSGKAVATTLTITTAAPSAALHESPMGRGAAPFYALLLPGLLGLVVVAGDGKRKWRSIRLLGLTAMLCALMVTLPACGGGSSGGTPSNPGTPVGSSTVTVTAAASTLSHPLPVTLTVQ